MILAHKIFDKKTNADPLFGYSLFLKTTKTTADFNIYFNVSVDTEYIAIDNNTAIELDIGINPTLIDLSASSGDASIYLKVDETGNGATNFNCWGIVGNAYYLDFTYFPLLNSFNNYMYGTVTIIGDMKELTYFKSYSQTYIGLDFSQTTKITYFRSYGSVYLDMPLDLSGNADIITIDTPIAGVNINPINHRKIVYLNAEITNSGGVLDANLNSIILPDLRTLIIRTDYYDIDFSTRNLSLVTSLTMNTKNIVGLSPINLPNLTYLSLTTDAIIGGTSMTIDGFTKLATLGIGGSIVSTPLTTVSILNCILLKTISLSIPKVTSLNIDANTVPIFEILSLYEISVSVLDLRPFLSFKILSMAYGYFINLNQIRIDNGLNTQVTLFQKVSTLSPSIDVVVDDPIAANLEQSPYLPTIWKKMYSVYQSFNWI